MKSWLDNVIDHIDFQKKNRENIAVELLEISGAAFSKNLSGKSELSFLNMIKLIKHLYENDTEITYMIRDFCKKTTNKKNIRMAMEYANAIGDFELLSIAINKGFASGNAKTYEWAFVYELVLMRSKNVLSDQLLLEELEARKKNRLVKCNEMKIMCDILTFYTLYDSREYKMLFSYAEMLLPKIEAISNPFVKDLYKSRIKEIIAYASLMDDQIEKSREACHDILNTEDQWGYLNLLKVSALGCLGESYSFDSYEQSLWYLNKGIQILDECHTDRALARKVQFLNMRSYIRLIHQKDLHDLQISDVGEKALYYIVTGNGKEAIRILTQLQKDNDSLSPMKTCYLGIALKSKDLLEKSIEGFINQGCKFYCRFPRKMLVEFNKNGIIYLGDAK
ncbi:AimR family lysis-lysogeny pheromone receptor [Bacillus sp. SM-B1]|uniref:AimR family lysis-lysogeny pheromone receptor n=1 Tax=Bacillus sp. SM-B1 TaxID=2980102 RepID=UPI002949EE7C|nr:AimR family lysis-lysogeny pheromone receptor [Bacillus sp. SM-B1]MDV6040393.1 AimR family lysis-lysogeny pheromone receptor [Bacillus sp. SM-B1]